MKEIEHENEAGVGIEQDGENVILTFYTDDDQQAAALFQHLFKQLQEGRLDFHLHKSVAEQQKPGIIIDAQGSA